MTLLDLLNSTTRIFLDSAPIIYYIEKHPVYFARVEPIFSAIDQGRITAITSPISLAECNVLPIRQGFIPLQIAFTDLMTNTANTILEPIGKTHALEAAQFRVKYNLSLTDAFQIAVAVTANCDCFLTNDLTLKRVKEIPVCQIAEL